MSSPILMGKFTEGTVEVSIFDDGTYSYINREGNFHISYYEIRDDVLFCRHFLNEDWFTTPHQEYFNNIFKTVVNNYIFEREVLDIKD